MAAPPLVSVVLPTRNRRPLLERAVRSVRSQAVQDLELLIVDDGSTDDTATWLRSLVDDPRVRTLSGRGVGVSAARNRAIAVATGTWVAFLDDDNEWEPTYLRAQLATAEADPGCGLVSSMARRRYEDGREELYPAFPAGVEGFDALLGQWFPLLSGCMVRRDLLARVGPFREDLVVAEDWDLLMRLARCTKVASTSEPLLVRHEHGGARLGDDVQGIRRAFDQLDRDWSHEIRARSGRRGLRRFRQAKVYQHHLIGFFATFDEDGRRGAVRATLGLARHLPGSSLAMVRPMLGMVAGPRAYAAARSTLRGSRGQPS